MLLPRRTLAVGFDLIGSGSVAKGSHTVVAALEDAGHTVLTETRQDLTKSLRVDLPLPALNPGALTLRLIIRDAQGHKSSELAQLVTAHAGHSIESG